MDASTVARSTAVEQSSGRLNIAIGMGSVALVLAVAFGVVGLQKGSQNLTRIHRLEAQVRRLSAHTGGAQATVTSRVTAVEGKLTALEGKATAGAAKQTKTEGTVAKLTSCVPELQTQISGLEITGTISSPYIKNGTNISKECQPILYGTH